MELGLHRLQFETLAYLVGQLNLADRLAVRLSLKRGGVTLEKGFFRPAIRFRCTRLEDIFVEIFVLSSIYHPLIGFSQTDC